MPPLNVEWSDNSLLALSRLHRFLAEDCGNPALAADALEEIQRAAEALAGNPYIGRPAGPEYPWCHELLVAFGKSGYLVLYEIFRREAVVILAVKHQLEVGYHEQW